MAGLDCPPLIEVLFPLSEFEPLTRLSDEEVAALVAWSGRHPEVALMAEGHADASGSEELNLALSFRRAEAVVVMLTDGGLAAERIQPRGYGEYQAMVGEPPDSDRNRRVIVRALGFEACAGPEGLTQ